MGHHYLIAVDLDGDVKMKRHKRYGLATLIKKAYNINLKISNRILLDNINIIVRTQKSNSPSPLRIVRIVQLN